MKIQVKNNSVYPKTIFAFGRGSYGFDLIEFCFSKEWHEMKKSVVFVASDGTRICLALDESSSVRIPREILTLRGKCLIFITGEHDGISIASVPIELWVAGDFITEISCEV